MSKKLKSLIVFLVVVVMAFSFTACLGVSGENESKETSSIEESEERESGVKTPSQAKDRLKDKGYSVYSINGRFLDALKDLYEGITGGFNGNLNQEDVTVYIFDTEENATKASLALVGYETYVKGEIVIFGTSKGVSDAKKAFNF